MSKPTILLVQAVDYDSRIFTGFQPQCSPLSIATVAALTPDAFEVDLWDENLDGPINGDTKLPHETYDIVGISTLFERVGHRVPLLAQIFKDRGSYICAGGPGISNQVSQINKCVDSIFVNEAELTWPLFLEEWTRGEPQREYVQVAKPDMSTSPPPKWGALANRITSYRAAGVQTTRGCPFDCEFCDVIYLYGRAQRHKPVENVLEEVRTLQQLGAKRIFFTDDEFVGDPKYTKQLLDALIPLNNSFPAPLAFHTQATLTLARKVELLEQMADANFWYCVVGIESFNPESLLETNKVQNCEGELVTNLRKILSYGLGINGSLIVGFDSDGPDIFERIFNGIQTSCVPMASTSILRATYGTKLWTRMRENKRLYKLRIRDQLPEALQVDILPAGALSRIQLLEGRIWLNNALAKVENICARLQGWVSMLVRLPQVHDPDQLTFEDALRRVREHEALKFSPEELRLVEQTLELTRDKAPVMMGRIVDSLVNQSLWRNLRSFHSQEMMDMALAAERAGDLVADTTPVLLPSAFAAAFRKRLFPYVYERLYRNMPDTKQVPEAASEVFVDFLVRLNDESAAMGEDDFLQPRHEAFLRQLCDRVAARVTGAPQDFVPLEEIDGSPIKGLKRTGMFDAVLKDIADRLRAINA